MKVKGETNPNTEQRFERDFCLGFFLSLQCLKKTRVITTLSKVKPLIGITLFKVWGGNFYYIIYNQFWILLPNSWSKDIVRGYLRNGNRNCFQDRNFNTIIRILLPQNYFIFSTSVVIEDTEAEVFDDKCSAQLKVHFVSTVSREGGASPVSDKSRGWNCTAT